MWSSHINQLVHLKEPEFPKVFTNFENQVGEYSIAYKKVSDDFEVISKIEKNEFNYDLIVKYKSTGVYDILHYNRAKNITEEYGYAVNDCLKNIKPGDSVKAGEYIYKSDNYDDDGNFAYGTNLKAVFLAYKGLTYEDGIVISKSAAKKMTSYKVEKTMFSINGNDVLINLYGDDENYRSFPHIGEHTKNKILVASRRKDKRTSLFDFQAEKMKVIDPTDDEIIYTNGGIITDINVYSNVPIADLRKRTDVFNQEILEIVENQYTYWKALAEELEKIIPVKILTEKEEKLEREDFGFAVKHPIEREKNSNKYTDELAYYWKLAHENIDERIQWRFDGKAFDNFKIEFTILKENPLAPGCKITRTLIFR